MRERHKKREAQERERKSYGLLSTLLLHPPFLPTQNNCHFVPLWGSWRSLPLLSIGRLRCIPLGSSQPIGSQGGRAPVQLVPKNVSAIDLFPGWPLLSSHSPQTSLFLSPPSHSPCCLLCFYFPLSLLPPHLLLFFFFSFPLMSSFTLSPHCRLLSSSCSLFCVAAGST